MATALWCKDPAPVNPDVGSGWDCCKLEAKLERNGLLSKAAALVLDPLAVVVVEGYDTDGRNGLVELFEPVEVFRPDTLGGLGT